MSELIKFYITPHDKMANRKIVYNVDDVAFSSNPFTRAIDFSVLVNDIEIGMFNQQAIQVAGYCPYQGWKKFDSSPSKYTQGDLKIEADLDNGSITRFTGPNEWDMYVNVETGWVCIGDSDASNEMVEFIHGAIASLKDGELVALWLKPEKLPGEIL